MHYDYAQRCKTCELCGERFFGYSSIEATLKWSDHIAAKQCHGNTDPDMEMTDER